MAKKMVQTKIFKSNQSQAVRLPKAVELPEGILEVEIVALGNTRIISPVGQCWDTWFDEAIATDDFMNEREQPPFQKKGITIDGIVYVRYGYLNLYDKEKTTSGPSNV